MRIGIDLTALLADPTGVDVYMLELVAALADVAPEQRYTWFVNREDVGRLGSRAAPNVSLRVAATRSRAARLGFQQLALPFCARHLDLLHSPSFILPLAARRPPHVLTVHDLTSFTHPETHIALRRSRPYKAAMLASVRRARRMLVPSEAVADTLVEVAGDPGLRARVRVVGHGVAARFAPARDEEITAARRAFDLPGPYVLFVGTVQPRKNLGALLQAFAQLTDRPETLVIVGGLGWDHDEVTRLAVAPGLAGRVRMLGYVDAGWLPALYTAARVFVYPSLAEGFGLPPLEAMSCGAPTLISDTPSLAERFGAAAARCGTDAEAIGAALGDLLRNRERRAVLRKAGLKLAAERQWERTAQATLAVYREATGDD